MGGKTSLHQLTGTVTFHLYLRTVFLDQNNWGKNKVPPFYWFQKREISMVNGYRRDLKLIPSRLHKVKGNISSKHYMKTSQVSKIKLRLFYKIKEKERKSKRKVSLGLGVFSYLP